MSKDFIRYLESSFPSYPTSPRRTVFIRRSCPKRLMARLLQPEMDCRALSPLVGFPPGGLDFQGIEVYRSDFLKSAEESRCCPFIILMSLTDYPSA